MFERETGGREPRANPTILPGNRRRGRVRRRPRRSREALRRIDRPRRGLGSGTRARREARRPEPAAARDRLLAVRGLAPAGDGPALERIRDRLHARHADQRLAHWSRTPSPPSGATTAPAGATSAPGSLRCGCASRRRSGPRAGGRPGTRTRVRRASAHAPGWVTSIASPGSSQHITVDPKVARALYYAWRAREELQLPAATVAPMVELRALGRLLALLPLSQHPPQPDQLRRRAARLRGQHDRRRRRCCAATTAASWPFPGRRQALRCGRGGSRTSGPSYSFHRNPFQRAGRPQNIESAEYANIVLDVIYYYEQARHAGMTPLSRRAGADAARMGQARAARLLDAQRLPELGHGPLPVPLAPVALLGVVVPGPARDRQLAELRRARRAALGEAHLRPLARAVRAPLPSAGTTTGASPAAASTASRPSSARAGTSSWRGSRRSPPRPCCAGLGEKAVGGAAAAVRVRPAIGRLTVTTPSLQHRDRRRQQRRLPLRRDRARAAVRLEPARRLAHRRPRAGRDSGWSCGRRAASIVAASQRARHRLHAGRRPIRC